MIAIDEAFGVDTARISHQARINAVAVDACFTGFTFRIGTATYGPASDVRVASVSCFTRTDRSVVLYQAGRIWTAGARIPAKTVYASFIRRTVTTRKEMSGKYIARLNNRALPV